MMNLEKRVAAIEQELGIVPERHKCGPEFAGVGEINAAATVFINALGWANRRIFREALESTTSKGDAVHGLMFALDRAKP